MTKPTSLQQKSKYAQKRSQDHRQISIGVPYDGSQILRGGTQILMTKLKKMNCRIPKTHDRSKELQVKEHSTQRKEVLKSKEAKANTLWMDEIVDPHS